MSLGEILRQRREEMDLTLDEVSNKVGFSKPYLSTIETGKVNNPPSDELLRKLEKVLKFQAGQLLVIAHRERMPADVRQIVESTESQNKKLWHVVKSMMKDQNQTQRLSQILEADKLEQESVVSAMPISAGKLVPIINKVAAGYPADFDDLDYPVGVADDYVRCPDLHDPQAFAVRVIGDSMEPKFREGDIVVFSPVAQIENGDDCFVRFSEPHETTFKRVFYEQNDIVRLQPRNEKYAPVMMEGKRINGVYKAVAKVERL